MTKPIQIKNISLGEGLPKICVPLTGKTEEEIKEETTEDEIVNRELINRKDGFYSENTHRSGKITYTFVG